MDKGLSRQGRNPASTDDPGLMSHDSPSVSSRGHKMGWESNSLQCGSKRIRPEDEVYLDNYHVQKRYLSEVMASSLNCLKVGDSFSSGSKAVPQNFDSLDSPALTETGCLSKSLSSYPSNAEELSTLDSYMTDDSDESTCYRVGRYCETPQRTAASFSEPIRSSPLKSYKDTAYNGQSLAASCSGGLLSCSSPLSTASLPMVCAQPRQRAPDAESRFPPSPSDPCYSADLRRAALLRSLHMRANSPVTALDTVGVDDCLDPSIHNLADSDDQCSPCSPDVDDSSAEQTACNQDILGSPVHGTFSSQMIGRGSGRARSLLLDECASVSPATFNDILSCVVEVSSLNSERQHSRGRDNVDCSIPTMYIEEVSESTDEHVVPEKEKPSS